MILTVTVANTATLTVKLCAEEAVGCSICDCGSAPRSVLERLEANEAIFLWFEWREAPMTWCNTVTYCVGVWVSVGDYLTSLLQKQKYILLNSPVLLK